MWRNYMLRLALAFPIALVAFVLSAIDHPYMFTRGKAVREDRAFYGCKEAETGCSTRPIPASRSNPNRVKGHCCVVWSQAMRRQELARVLVRWRV